MAVNPTVHVVARFTRGGFGNERTYHITESTGGEAVGLASWWYCLDAGNRPIEAEPSVGQEIDGLLEARVLSEPSTDTVKLYLPDGEVRTVRRDQIRRGIPAATPETYRHVSV